VAAIACGAEVVELDSCFNGAYTAPLYQAGAYLFGAGTTRAVVANSVNIAQDVVGSRHLGILAQGGRVGAWHKARPHLESHLFGDPTFHFAPVPGTEAVTRQLALASLPATADGDRALLAALQHDPAAIVRLEALAQLAGRRTAALSTALPIAARDPSASVRRAAIGLMGDVGDTALLPHLLRAALRDSCQRVAYRARDALAKYDAGAVAQAFAEALAALPLPPADDTAVVLRRMQTAGFIADYRNEAADRALELKKRIRAIRTFRLYRVHAVVPELLALATADDEEVAVRQAALDSLGWFVYSTQRDTILAAAQKLADDDGNPAAVRAEARKTLRHLQAGANDALLP
jgi:hypothetical protein